MDTDVQPTISLLILTAWLHGNTSKWKPLCFLLVTVIPETHSSYYYYYYYHVTNMNISSICDLWWWHLKSSATDMVSIHNEPFVGLESVRIYNMQVYKFSWPVQVCHVCKCSTGFTINLLYLAQRAPMQYNSNESSKKGPHSAKVHHGLGFGWAFFLLAPLEEPQYGNIWLPLSTQFFWRLNFLGPVWVYCAHLISMPCRFTGPWPSASFSEWVVIYFGPLNQAPPPYAWGFHQPH